MTKKEREAQAVEAKAWLLERVKAGARIYTALKHVSSSGMSRRISLYMVQGEEIQRLTWATARVLGYKYNDSEDSITVSGCGMDMGYHLVYSLSRVLFQENFECLGDAEGVRCPSNDHANGSRDYSKHMHSDGGYALNHSWL